MDEVRDRIQRLAEEIAVVRGLDAEDPGQAGADRVVAENQAAIGRLRLLLPRIPSGPRDPGRR